MSFLPTEFHGCGNGYWLPALVEGVQMCLYPFQGATGTRRDLNELFWPQLKTGRAGTMTRPNGAESAPKALFLQPEVK